MLYCTPQNVRDLHRLISDEPDTFHDDYINGFIKKAQTRIDNRLRLYYRVPLVNPVPDIIQSICADMAASMLLDHHFSEYNRQENTPLADVFRKRADTDLDDVVDNFSIDGLPGVVKHAPPSPTQRPQVMSTTPRRSPLHGVLSAFDRHVR